MLPPLPAPAGATTEEVFAAAIGDVELSARPAHVIRMIVI
jgi:hypothetical protein